MADTDPNLGGVFISTSQIYNTLLELKYEVRDMASKLDSSSKQTGDHEPRIRDLERWKYATSAALVSAMAALMVEFVRIFSNG